MQTGDRVKITAGYRQGKTGIITGQIIYPTGYDWRVEIDGGSDWCYCDEEHLEVIEKGAKKVKDGCTCGCSSVGSPKHIWYCYLFKEDDK